MKGEIIVRSNIKKYLPEGMRISSDFASALSKKVIEIIQKAVERAKANHRTTVMAYDI
jgi:histone H3/H4